MAESTIATIDRGATRDVRVILSHFKGHDYVHVRQYEGDPGGDRHPTRKGVVLAVEQIPELLAAVRKLEETLRRNGLLDDPDQDPG